MPNPQRWLKRDKDLLNYIKELGGEIENVSEIEEIEEKEIAPTETQGELLPEEK